MTTTEVGRELDVAVAKVMGWELLSDERGWPMGDQTRRAIRIPTYSANNDAGVWEMLQWLMENTDGGLKITVRNEYCAAAIPRYSAAVVGDTLPHALALLVVQVAEQETSGG